MKTSEKGLQLIAGFEGLRLAAYPDPGTGGEPWTIGYGHTDGVRPGDRCTEAQAMGWLQDDVRFAEAAVARNVTVALEQNQFDALVSFTFNLGAGAFAQSTLLRLLNRGDYAGAAGQFGRWVHVGAAVLHGLVRRRAAERALFETPAHAKAEAA